VDSTQAKFLHDSLQNVTVGGWHISGSFGYGKSAVVLPAVKDGQHSAIKIFHSELIERFGKSVQLERILRETSLIDANHPNLVRILDGGECSVTGHLYVVMESLPYGNLQEKLPLLPIDAVRHLIFQVASAARYLEDRGLAIVISSLRTSQLPTISRVPSCWILEFCGRSVHQTSPMLTSARS
jgi:serine/threonine protein kinase